MAPVSQKNTKQTTKDCIQCYGKINKTSSKYFSSRRQGKVKQIKQILKADGGKNANEAPTLSPSSEQRLPVNNLNPKRLGREFFDSPTEILAVALLGKLLCRVSNEGKKLCGRIVETEAYLGEIDKACHSYGGRRTARNEAMYGSPGTCYVYFIYGLYHCFNISSQEQGACVLVRALEPIEGFDKMRILRNEKRKPTSKPLKDHDLTNGPSKLCTAMNINKTELNHTDLATSDCFWIEEDSVSRETQVVHTTRIGILSYGEDAANKPYRYYVLGNKCVSVRDKIAEKALMNVEN